MCQQRLCKEGLLNRPPERDKQGLEMDQNSKMHDRILLHLEPNLVSRYARIRFTTKSTGEEGSCEGKWFVPANLGDAFDHFFLEQTTLSRVRHDCNSKF